MILNSFSFIRSVLLVCRLVLFMFLVIQTVLIVILSIEFAISECHLGDAHHFSQYFKLACKLFIFSLEQLFAIIMTFAGYAAVTHQSHLWLTAFKALSFTNTCLLLMKYKFDNPIQLELSFILVSLGYLMAKIVAVVRSKEMGVSQASSYFCRRQSLC